MEKKCKNCGDEIGVLDPIFGLCTGCKKAQERAYDNYVDPRGFYQSKSIENND